MTQPTIPRRPKRWPALAAAAVLAAGILAGAFHGRLTAHLNGEYFNIAKAIFAGRGFADPFGAPTGATAWQAPLLPVLEAAVLWASDGATSAVVRVLVVLHVSILIATGLLVIAMARQTSGSAGAMVAAIAFAVGLLANYRLCFELASDGWLNLLFLDLFLVGLFWRRPLDRWQSASAWGLLGGIAALANPTLGFVWVVLTAWLGMHERARRRSAMAMLVALAVTAPWMIRNYLEFGRLIPVKSNLGYELFQAQCLQPPGVLTVAAIRTHPSNAASQERKEYVRLGEADYVARKWEQFAAAVHADPLDFVDRFATRFLCATLWYESSNPAQDARRPWLLWLNRCVHALPFAALVILLFQGRLLAIEWFAMGMFALYLLPYVAVSYYDRYGLPLIAVKTLLVVWAIERLAAAWRSRWRLVP